MARHLSLLVLLVGFNLASTGCQQEQEDLSKLGQSIQERVDLTVTGAVDKARTKLDELRAHEVAEGEFNKLNAFEYHVESVFLPTTASDLQIRLNELGKDKWDCGTPVVGLTERAAEVPQAARTLETSAGLERDGLERSTSEKDRVTATGQPAQRSVNLRATPRAPERLALVVCQRRPASYLRMIKQFAP